MSDPKRYVCTLCNVEFPAQGSDAPRCPHCLRLTGIVPAAVPSLSREAWRPGRRSLLVLACVIVTAGLAVSAWFLVPLLKSSDEADSVVSTLTQAGLPVPWGDPASLDDLVAPLVSLAPAQAAEALSAACHRRSSVRLVAPDELPGEFRTGAEVARLDRGAVTRVEAAACMLALAMAADLPAVPCTLKSSSAKSPAWDRAAGICLGDASSPVVAAPGIDSPEATEWQPVTLTQFAAIYLAGAAEAATTQASVYALFRQARNLWDDPTFLFRLGVTKARLGVKEFAVEDMRQALAAGAPTDGNLLLADTLLELGQASEALAVYERAGADEPRVLLGKARTLLVLDQPDKAGAVLEPLAADHPELEGVLDTVASWKLRTGDTAGALAAIEKAITHRPRPDHFLMLDDLLSQQNKGAESIPRLAAGYESTRDLRVGERLVRRQLEQGLQEEAVAFSARLVKEHSGERAAHGLRFDALLAGGRFGDVDREADSLLRGEPSAGTRPALVAASIARLVLEAKGGKGIAPAADTVKQLAQSGPRGVHGVTGWLGENGYPELAERSLVLALESRPGDEELTNHLYLLYGLHGRADEARKVREQALTGLEGDARDAREDSLDRIDRYIQSSRGK